MAEARAVLGTSATAATSTPAQTYAASRVVQSPLHLIKQASPLSSLCSQKWFAAASGAVPQPILELEKQLQDGRKINKRGAWGRTAVWFAAHCNQPEALEYLLAHGASSNPGGDFETGDTPLHAAAHAGATRCVQLLLQAGADVSARNMVGERAIDRTRAAGGGSAPHRLAAAAVLEGRGGGASDAVVAPATGWQVPVAVGGLLGGGAPLPVDPEQPGRHAEGGGPLPVALGTHLADAPPEPPLDRWLRTMCLVRYEKSLEYAAALEKMGVRSLSDLRSADRQNTIDWCVARPPRSPSHCPLPRVYEPSRSDPSTLSRPGVDFAPLPTSSASEKSLTNGTVQTRHPTAAQPSV